MLAKSVSFNVVVFIIYLLNSEAGCENGCEIQFMSGSLACDKIVQICNHSAQQVSIFIQFSGDNQTSRCEEFECKINSEEFECKINSKCILQTSGGHMNCSDVPTPTTTPDPMTTVTGGLGALITVQFLALLGVTIGWICTCSHTIRRKYNINEVWSENTAGTSSSNSQPIASPLPSAQLTTPDPSYTVIGAPEESHMYDVIPATSSTAFKKQPASTLEPIKGAEQDNPYPCLPPSSQRVSAHHCTHRLSLPLPIIDPFSHRLSALACDAPKTQTPTAIPSKSLEPQMNIYHVLDPELQESRELVESDNNSEHIYHVLEDGGINNPNQHVLGRISWFGSEDSVIGLDKSVSPTVTEEELERGSPITYEVPVSLFSVQDQANSL